MVQIQPFQGLRYDPARLVSGYEAIVAPPYDVISSEEQQQLHEKSPYNIVRLILGFKKPTDDEADNVYSRARDTLESWQNQGILKAENEPAVYAYAQTWENVERRGFIARMLLESYETGKVLPHENTLGGPKADRLALTKATGCILSPIFCLYDDPLKQAESLLFESPAPPDAIAVQDADGVLHRFWPVTDSAQIQALQTLLQTKTALIADGHHRYETALAYRDWRRQEERQEDAPPGSFPWDFTMAFFTNMADPGLRIYPTHRVLTSLPGGLSEADFRASLYRYFEPTTEEQALFWLQTTSQSPREPFKVKPGLDLSSIPQPFVTLDVALLDYFVFQGILGQSANDLKQRDRLQFVRNEAEVRSLLQRGAIVFWVHAPDVSQVRNICQAGLRMPQKSTYFYPKLLSGLVLYCYKPHATAPASRIGCMECSSSSHS